MFLVSFEPFLFTVSVLPFVSLFFLYCVFCVFYISKIAVYHDFVPQITDTNNRNCGGLRGEGGGIGFYQEWGANWIIINKKI